MWYPLLHVRYIWTTSKLYPWRQRHWLDRLQSTLKMVAGSFTPDVIPNFPAQLLSQWQWREVVRVVKLLLEWIVGVELPGDEVSGYLEVTEGHIQTTMSLCSVKPRIFGLFHESPEGRKSWKIAASGFPRYSTRTYRPQKCTIVLNARLSNILWKLICTCMHDWIKIRKKIVTLS